MNAPKTLIFILGMHRSGTSALTRMINLLGARLGEALLEAQTGVNDRGFWENREMVALNEAILRRLDSAWFDYGEYPQSWWRTAGFADFREQIRGWLEENFRDAELTALKDPRLCRLLPIWREAAQQAGFQCQAIVTLRAPHEVRQSLLRRDPFSPLTCDLLWLRYLADAEDASRDLPRAMIDYRHLLQDWNGAADTIATRLSLRWPTPPAQAAPAISAEIDPALRRQSAEDESMRSPISAALDAIHQTLTTALPGIPEPSRHDQTHSLLQEHAACAPLILDANRRLASKSDELQRTGEALAHAHEVVAAKDRGIAELDRRLQKLGREHAKALNTISTRDKQLAERDKQLAERDKQLAERNLEFEKLVEWTGQLEKDLRKSGEWLQQLEHDLEKCGEWGREMEAQARKNWQTYEEAARQLNRIHDHPVAGRLCRSLKLQEPS